MVRRLIPQALWMDRGGSLYQGGSSLCRYIRLASIPARHLVAPGAAGRVLVRKEFTQNQLLTVTATMEISLIGLEACYGAHFLACALRNQGHDVRPIPAQLVKPFVNSNKNDFLDAEAIAEAVERKNMRFVPIETERSS
jgi:transposase